MCKTCVDLRHGRLAGNRQLKMRSAHECVCLAASCRQRPFKFRGRAQRIPSHSSRLFTSRRKASVNNSHGMLLPCEDAIACGRRIADGELRNLQTVITLESYLCKLTWSTRPAFLRHLEQKVSPRPPRSCCDGFISITYIPYLQFTLSTSISSL